MPRLSRERCQVEVLAVLIKHDATADRETDETRPALFREEIWSKLPKHLDLSEGDVHLALDDLADSHLVDLITTRGLSHPTGYRAVDAVVKYSELLDSSPKDEGVQRA